MSSGRTSRDRYAGRSVISESLESEKRDHLSRLERSVEAVRAAVRRESGGSEAIGQRAAATRQRVLDAAEVLFAEKGYSAPSVNEIARAAGVRLPTLYQYFSGKAGIFAVLVGERAIEMMAQGVDEWTPDSGRAGLRHVIQQYVATYAKHSAFFRAWEDATQAEPSIATLRREWNMVYKLRFAEAIRVGQDSGLVAATEPPHELARWLTRGLESYCFDVMLFDPPKVLPSIDEISDTLTGVWADTLRIVEPI
jgi:AcrR family transcriptional regulator